jgi:hypothetical protein
MTPENFVYWFQGWLELERPEAITSEQLEVIKNHLQLVFNKVTPDMRMYTIEHSTTAYGLVNKNSDVSIDPTNVKKTDGIKFYPYIPTACEDGLPGTRLIQATGIDPGMQEILKRYNDGAYSTNSKTECSYCNQELKSVPGVDGYGGSIANDNSLLRFMGGPGLSC